jgi:hypothetical protein
VKKEELAMARKATAATVVVKVEDSAKVLALLVQGRRLIPK